MYFSCLRTADLADHLAAIRDIHGAFDLLELLIDSGTEVPAPQLAAMLRSLNAAFTQHLDAGDATLASLRAALASGARPNRPPERER